MRVNRKNEAILSAQIVRSLFNYNPLTGSLTWKALSHKKANHLVGQEAGTAHDKGYRMVTIFKRRYFVHRVVWLYMTGAWPADHLDHKDGKTWRNVWDNLREATTLQNAHNLKLYKNNTSGHRGIRLRGSRWYARIRARGVDYNLGSFETLEAAQAARLAKKAEIHPFQPVDRT